MIMFALSISVDNTSLQRCREYEHDVQMQNNYKVCNGSFVISGKGHAVSADCRYYKFWRLINISRRQIDGLKILEDVDVDVLKKFPPIKYV